MNKSTLIIGLGLSGRAAARFLLRRGERVEGTDDQLDSLIAQGSLEECLHAGLILQTTTEVNIEKFKCVILSPGVPSTHPLVQRAHHAGIPVQGEIDLGCQALKQKTLGITGTNGKTTVTLLVTHILNTWGIAAKALGNVGVPLTQEVSELKDETVVLELSSYQLETLQQPVLDAAVLLNITPDHLDRYLTLEAYAAAKCRIGRCMKPRGVLYVEEEAADRYANQLGDMSIATYGYHSSNALYTDCDHVYGDSKYLFSWPDTLAGKKSHYLENALAAYALCRTCGVPDEVFIAGLTSFTYPQHRMTFVGEKDGVRYYDDSKGTNLDAVVRAVQTFNGPLLLIAGGVDKGAPYTAWITPFQGKVKWIGAIGQAAVKIQADLAGYIPVDRIATLEQAVLAATQRAQPGDTILLSPGCASFDQFKDYVHRGKEFQRVVHEYVNMGEK